MILNKTIHVAYLAVEADPLIKVGGLGDVAGSLPRALNDLSPQQIQGHALDVRLFLPFHGSLRSKIDPPLVDEFTISTTTGPVPARVYQYDLNHLIVYLISGQPFAENEPVYTAVNNFDGEKYTFFTVAVLEFLKRSDWKPDIFHANDWHTAPGTYLVAQERKTKSSLANTRTVLSVHNLPYSGRGAHDALAHYHIPPSPHPLLPPWTYHQPLPLGLQFADQIIAVSPQYAREILTPEFGCEMDAFLQSRQLSISGILNGLDIDCWNPATDPLLARNFSTQSLEERLQNKAVLLKALNLTTHPEAPLFVYISRMDSQKGVDLIPLALNTLLDRPWSVVLLGTGDPELMRACQDLQSAHPDRVRAEMRFDAQLAHQLYASGDVILMPSRYEPCGLSQLIAMRYGCVPVARATGGLKDTIVDHNIAQSSNGFLFNEASSTALAEAIDRSIQAFKQQDLWKGIQSRGMQADFSWHNSAVQYAQTYLTLMEKPL